MPTYIYKYEKVLVLKGSESSMRNLHVSRSETCFFRSDRNLRKMSVLLLL